MNRLSLLLAMLCLPAGLFGQGQWLLTDSGFATRSVTLGAIDASGVQVSAGTQKIALPFERFLQLERPASAVESAEKFALYLANGDLLRGEPTGTVKEELQWRSSALGDLAISLRELRALVRQGQKPNGIEAERLEDVVLLLNGDSVRGIVSSIETKSLRMAGSDVNVAMASVAAVLFAAPAQKKQPPARSFRVRLTDGSVFTAPSIEVRDESLTLILADKRRRQAPLTGVVLIEQMNGPVSWLSTRPPDLIEQIPFLEENFPPRMDRTVEDKPIRFGKTNYARGIGVHSHSILAWDLDGGYEAFRTQYAIDEGRNEKANVTVRIKLDDKTVHEKENVRAGVLSETVVIPLAGAKRLTLEVDFGAGIHTQGRLNWIEPALLRNMPQPPSR